MTNLLNKIKEYINDVAYNVKKVLPLKDDLDKIIERKYEETFEILEELGIIEYIKRKYKMDYEIPELEILEDEPRFIGKYIPSENKIIFSKEGIKIRINKQLKFLGYEKIKRSINYIRNMEDLKYWKYKYPFIIWKYSELSKNEISFLKKYIEAIDKELKSLGYKETKDIEYLNMSYNSILLYPFYINKRNIRKSIAKFIILLTMFHEFWHSIDFSILDKLEKDPTIKDRDYLITILNDHDNIELRASAFQVVIYYLASGFYKDERAYKTVYANIPICRTYIEKMDILEKNDYMKENVPYDLGFCYGSIIIAKYGSSLEENIYNIIDDIIHLDKKKTIDVIKLYGDNLEWISNDKNSNNDI